MPGLAPDCPAIHVAFSPLADEGLFRWVQVGAEEEGVPCRRVTVSARGNTAALAYAAAESSRLRIGVAVDRSEVVLHEMHMPAPMPVLRFRLDGQETYRCRLMGSNAARLVVRLPFRFPGEEPELFGPEWAAKTIAAVNGNGNAPQASIAIAQTPAPALANELSPAEIADIVGLIARRLAERGIGV